MLTPSSRELIPQHTDSTLGLQFAWADTLEGGVADLVGGAVPTTEGVEEEVQGEDEDEELIRDVFITESVYDAVIVAVFGGVAIPKPGAKRKNVLVHPFWIFMFALALFWVQICMLSMLLLDQDITARVHVNHLEDYAATWSLKGNMLLTMQVLQLVTVQFLLFNVVFSRLSMFAFLVNPATWVEVRRPGTRSRDQHHPAVQAMYHFAIVGFLAFAANTLKMVVTYLVCVLSASIVLDCDSAKSAIFNGLVIIFVAELDEPLWKVVCKVINIKIIVSDEKSERTQRYVQSLAEFDFFVDVNREDQLGPLGKHMNQLIARTKIDHVAPYILVIWFYMRNLFIVLHALDTDVIPASRDACTLWRFHTQNQKEAWHDITAWLYRHMLEPLLNDSVRMEELALFCEDGDYDRMNISDALGIMKKHPGIVMWFGIGLTLCLVGPQLITVLTEQWKQANHAKRQSAYQTPLKRGDV